MTTLQKMIRERHAGQGWAVVLEMPNSTGTAASRRLDALAITRDLIRRGRHHRLPDEVLAALPEISRHNDPQIEPQEYDCGCVAICRITDRDAQRDGKPFEMRLAIACGAEACEARPRAPAAGAIDYAKEPWERLDAVGRYWGVFATASYSPDPVAVFTREEDAREWIAWCESRGDDNPIGGCDYTICAAMSIAIRRGRRPAHSYG